MTNVPRPQPWGAIVTDDLVIVGGGPSGLAAAYEAVCRGAKVLVLERLAVVGGLSRTTVFEGNRLNVGPHRFFTKNQEVRELFVKTAANDLLNVPRLTRIIYNQKYFNYPLTALNVLGGVGLSASFSIAASYATARARRAVLDPPIKNFEDWVVDQFGRRLFETFFKTYTEKVWGIPCTQIGADWAERRIKGLNLRTAAINALFKSNKNVLKTLIDEFSYPRHGAGQLYEKMAANVTRGGSRVITGARVTGVHRNDLHVTAVEVEQADGEHYTVDGRQFLVSAPLTEMIEMMSPEPPSQVAAACRALRYRNHIGVNLVVKGSLFPDNWIYVHSGEVRMVRIANYVNFSTEMAARPGLNPLTVEYFCFRGDNYWEAADEELIERAKRELVYMNILQPDQIIGSFVVRSDKAYPSLKWATLITSPRLRAGSINSTTFCRSVVPACSSTTIRITPWRPECSPPARRWGSRNTILGWSISTLNTTRVARNSCALSGPLGVLRKSFHNFIGDWH